VSNIVKEIFLLSLANYYFSEAREKESMLARFFIKKKKKKKKYTLTIIAECKKMYLIRGFTDPC